MAFRLVLLWGCCLGAAHAQTLAQRADLVNFPRAGAPVTADTLNLGALRLVPKGAARQLMAGDKACGLVLGGGRFELNITDPFSIEPANRNLASVPGAKFADTFDKAVIWTYDDLGAVSAGEGATEAMPWLENLMKHAQFDLPALDMLTADMGSMPGMVYVLLHHDESTGGKYYLYRRDPFKDQMESFWVLDKFTGNTSVRELAGGQFAYRLACQPIGRKWWERFAAPLVAVYENIQVDNPEGDRVDITTTTKLQVMEDGINLWRVNLVGNVFGNRYDARPNRVLEVRVDGRAAEFVHQSHELLVDLGRVYKAGDLLTVVTRTSGDIAVHPDGDQYWTLGTWAWYPQPDLNGELAMLEMTVRAPNPLVPIASGTTVSVEEADGFTTLKTRFTKPVQFPVVGAGRWRMFPEKKNGLTCNVGSYVTAREKGAARLRNNFFVAAKYFEELYGVAYPFEDLTVLEINNWGSAQAPAGVIFLPPEAFDTKGSLVNQLFSEGVNEMYAHEVAHAWWGHVVKMDSGEEQWLTESFAEYSAALFIKVARGKRGEAEFKKIVGHWRGNTRKIGKGGSIYLANYLARYADIDYFDRQFLLYNKGPLVLHALRQELGAKYGEEKGDQIFFTLLRSFVANFQFKWGATRHLIGILNQITGTDWQPWFERYVYGTETPKIKL